MSNFRDQKEISELHRLKKSIDEMKKEYAKKYMKIYNKKYYWTKDYETKREERHEYYLKNRDRILDRYKEKRGGNVKRYAKDDSKLTDKQKYYREYYRANRDRYLERQRGYRERLKEQEASAGDASDEASSDT